MRQTGPSKRVLTAHVDVALLASACDGSDRHRLDDRIRIIFHEHAIFECAGLGLIGVADDIVRPLGLRRDGLPLAPGGERRAAAPGQSRFDDFADDSRGPDVERAPQRCVSTVGAIFVETAGIDAPDASQEPQACVPGLRQSRRRCHARFAAAGDRDSVVRAQRRERRGVRRIARVREQRRGSALALPQALTAPPVRRSRALQAIADIPSAGG
jgi:hypothetical protein